MLHLIIFVVGVIAGSFLPNPIANAIKKSVIWVWGKIKTLFKKIFKIKE
jgi:hypothetical protein